MKIVNLTQHTPTPEQVAAGVFTSTAENAIRQLLTFDMLPNVAAVVFRARDLARIAQTSGATHALIGGAPYLMSPLEWHLKQVGVVPLYAFSERVSSEEVQPDGSVRKVNTFKHGGFYSPILPTMGEDDLSHEGE
jgi:hypothetical protein